MISLFKKKLNKQEKNIQNNKKKKDRNMDKLAVDFGMLEDENITGQQHIFFVQPPVEYVAQVFKDGELTEVAGETSWVVSSATWIDVLSLFAESGGAETFLFPSTKDGDILDWAELEGSVKGAWDCNLPLLNRGYQIIRRIKKDELDILKVRKIPTP